MAVSVSEQVAPPQPFVAPAASVDAWIPVAAIAHLAQGGPADPFLSVLPDDVAGARRGPRRSTWRS